MRVYRYRSGQSKTQPASGWRRASRRFRGLISKSASRKRWLTWLFRLAAAGVLFIALLALYYSASLPKTNQLLNRAVSESTKIYARDGTLLYDIHGEVNRTRVDLDQISGDLKHATIAGEDKNFYSEGGVSFTGLARSVIVDVFSFSKKQGGSTITQQFVKNALLTNEKRFSRKLKEIFLSIEIDAAFSKDQILTFYLNEIPYGRNAYGIEAASHAYFNKSAKDLTLAESAYLAALPQAPTYFNPFGPHRDALDGRKDYILGQMQNQGYITQEQYRSAKNGKVAFNPIKNRIIAPHFVFYVQDYLANKYGETTLQEGGLKVYTTLDPKLQVIAEKAVSDGIAKVGLKNGARNAALVAIDPKTGQILAMVGSKDYFGDPEPAGCTPGKNCDFEPNVNVAVTEQQPGSSIKPTVYVTAFGRDFGYSPASMLMDVHTNFGTFGGKAYEPDNYNGKNYGPVSMRQALAGSLNVPAVKTLALIGVDNAIQTARKLGYTSPFADCGLSLVLGGCEVKLLDHTGAFAVYANGGKRNGKTPIMKVQDRDGNALEEYQQHEEQVLDPQAVYELTSILSDNSARSFIFGSNSPLTLPGRPVAAKTGTTQKNRDAWTMGFTPSLAAGVWAGNNDETPMKTDAVVIAGPIWHQFMVEALKDAPVEQFERPSGITEITVDSVSGKLPTQYTPSTKTEVFADYAVPKDYDDVHVVVKIDRLTSLPASELTPPDQIDFTPYTVLHSEKRDNSNWENAVIGWALANGYQYPSGSQPYISPPGGTGNGQDPNVDIVQPSDNAIITSVPFQVSVTATSSQGIARLDFSVDGGVIGSIASPPYLVSIDKKYANGPHTITVHAVDGQGATSDTSVTVNFAIGQDLILIEPGSNEQLNFPVALTATSPNLYGSVEFYYQSGNNSAKLIGPVDTVSNLQGQFHYSVTWNSPPKSGTYKVFAKGPGGITSPKITVLVP